MAYLQHALIAAVLACISMLCSGLEDAAGLDTARIIEQFERFNGVRVQDMHPTVRQVFENYTGCWEGPVHIVAGLCTDLATPSEHYKYCCADTAMVVDGSMRFWELDGAGVPMLSVRLRGNRLWNQRSGHTVDLLAFNEERSLQFDIERHFPLVDFEIEDSRTGSLGVGTMAPFLRKDSPVSPRLAWPQEIHGPACFYIAGGTGNRIKVLDISYIMGMYSSDRGNGLSELAQAYVCPDRRKEWEVPLEYGGERLDCHDERNPISGPRTLPNYTGSFSRAEPLLQWYALERSACPSVTAGPTAEVPRANDDHDLLSQDWFWLALIAGCSFFLIACAGICLLCLWKRRRRHRLEQEPPPSPKVSKEAAQLEPTPDSSSSIQMNDDSHFEMPINSIEVSPAQTFPGDETLGKSASLESVPASHAQRSNMSSDAIPSSMYSAVVFDNLNVDAVVKLGLDEHWFIQSGDVKVVAEKDTDKPRISGAFGQVYQGLLFDNTPIALKVPSLGTNKSDSRELKALVNEVRLFRRIRHQNVVLFHGLCILTSPCQMVSLVLEWVDGGDFRQFVLSRRKNTTFQRECGEMDVSGPKECKALRDVALGMQYLHMSNILHLDLKPANILIERSDPLKAKITDFGLSKIIVKEAVQHKVGTMRYMAPEVDLGKPYGKPADVFSFGCVVAFALGQYHFSKAEKMNALEEAFTSTLEGKLPVIMHTFAIQGRQCVLEEPSGRPTFHELLQSTNVGAKPPAPESDATSTTARSTDKDKKQKVHL